MLLGQGVLLGTVVLVGQEVWDGTGVVVADGVIDGVQVMVGVLVGRGVLLGSGVIVGSAVLVGGGGGEGVGVVDGVGDAVHVTTKRGTAFLVRLQPLSNNARTPKSEFTTPVNGPPPPQSLSKSTSQRYWVPALNGKLPVQIDEEE